MFRLLLLVVVTLLLDQSSAFEVALFPSTGCYSHDVMMREVGEALGPSANVTWIQTFIFDFGFGEIGLPSNWSRISLRGHDDERTPYSAYGMTFGQRVGNSLFHSIIVLTRYIQIYVLNSMFARKGFPQVEIVQSEAERVIYAGRSEFLFDVIRPINNRVKHFGGVSKMNPRDYVTVIPGEDVNKNNRVSCRAPTTGLRYLNNSTDNPIGANSTTVPLSFINCVCSSKSAAVKGPTKRRRAWLYEGVTADKVKKRFNSISEEFPQLEWPSLTTKPFILVSFGSVAQ
ncbi:hypothetical protein OSTOST_04034, partial [Ostertagia ostertagi]